jgi:lipopolysaccharide/colanic/teichoic acid biosynthesis glycosyltransferase
LRTIHPKVVEEPLSSGPCSVGESANMTGTGRALSDPMWERGVRRVVDVVVAGALLVLTAPVLAVLAVWIRLDSPGPAIFRQQRVGQGGALFTFYKFRSMRSGGDDRAHRQLIEAELRGEDTCCGGSTKLEADPRITSCGRFLRRSSMDELPQLVNVVRGDMSLVGPRPCLPWEAALFPARYAERFTVRPGLTGLWQVRGRSAVGTREMLELDLEYVRTRSLSGDISLLLATVPALLRGGGAR